MELVNLTPHALSLYTPAGVKEIPASGQLARVRASSEVVAELEGLAVARPTFEGLTGLPEPRPNTVYVVASLVLTALRAEGTHRPDIVAPGTGPNDGAIRDSAGRVVGITRFNCM